MALGPEMELRNKSSPSQEVKTWSRESQMSIEAFITIHGVTIVYLFSTWPF